MEAAWRLCGGAEDAIRTLAPVNFVEERVARQAARQVCRVQGRVKGRAANSRGPGGPTGPLGTPPRIPWIQIGEVP